MSNIFDIEKAKVTALSMAETSNSNGCLFAEMPEEKDEDWTKGDPETLETIVSLVLSEGIDGMDNDEAEVVLIRYLQGKFPDF